MARIDRAVGARLAKAGGVGSPATRGDLAREALGRGIAQIETELGIADPPPALEVRDAKPRRSRRRPAPAAATPEGTIEP